MRYTTNSRGVTVWSGTAITLLTFELSYDHITGYDYGPHGEGGLRGDLDFSKQMAILNDIKRRVKTRSELIAALQKAGISELLLGR